VGIKDPLSVHILMNRGLAGAIEHYVRDQVLVFNEENGGVYVLIEYALRCKSELRDLCISSVFDVKFIAYF
jgi:hypothetical protein